jgi:hypothetical protein
VQLVDDRFPVRGTPVERGELPLDPAQAPGQFAQRTRDAIVSRRRLFPGPRVLLVLARARRAGDRGRVRFCASQSGSPLSAAPGGNGFAAGRGVLPFIPVPTPMGTRPHVHSAILQDTQATMGTRYARELRTYSWSAGLESVMGLHSGRRLHLRCQAEGSRPAVNSHGGVRINAV